MIKKSRKIGFTTTIPHEIIIASGNIPVDLNNIFINSKDPLKYIQIAEDAGYPRNICSWIKGIYGVILSNPEIKDIILVSEGDCSNTKALGETLQLLPNIKLYEFAYSSKRDKTDLEKELSLLKKSFPVKEIILNSVIEDIVKIRKKLVYLDELTWKYNKINGKENHIYLVESSDFNGNYKEYQKNLQNFLDKAEKRKKLEHEIRLGFIGVPPIFSDFYDYLENLSVHVVYNEIQRQFSMPECLNNLAEQFINYRYPYSIFYRLEDIKKQIKKRQINGIIHYTQTFCHRQIEDMVIREKLDIPVLTIEGDLPGNIDARTRLRIEAFIDMLKDL